MNSSTKTTALSSERSPKAPQHSLGHRPVTSEGTQLAPALRSKLESQFDFNFEKVRIHSDYASDRMSRAINASAFTIASDVFFAQGEYSPDTNCGRKLLTHELVHVVQQSKEGSSVNTEANLDAEAASLSSDADAVAHIDVSLHTSPGILRQEAPETHTDLDTLLMAKEWLTRWLSNPSHGAPTTERAVNQQALDLLESKIKRARADVDPQDIGKCYETTWPPQARPWPAIPLPPEPSMQIQRPGGGTPLSSEEWSKYQESGIDPSFRRHLDDGDTLRNMGPLATVVSAPTLLGGMDIKDVVSVANALAPMDAVIGFGADVQAGRTSHQQVAQSNASSAREPAAEMSPAKAPSQAYDAESRKFTVGAAHDGSKPRQPAIARSLLQNVGPPILGQGNPPHIPSEVKIPVVRGITEPSGKAPLARYRQIPTPQQRAEAWKHIDALQEIWKARGLPLPEVTANMDLPTSWINGKPGGSTVIRRINLGYNLAPAKNIEQVPLPDRANAALSPRAAISHEGTGHYEAFIAGRAHPVHEETQASLRAAIHGPGLNRSDRSALIRDAVARLGDFEQGTPMPGRETLRARWQRPTMVLPPGIWLDPLPGPVAPVGSTKTSPQPTRLAIRGVESTSHSASATAAGTPLSVFGHIQATDPPREGTSIPRSFIITTTSGKAFWVSGSATEHFSEIVKGYREYWASTERGDKAPKAVKYYYRPISYSDEFGKPTEYVPEHMARGSTWQTFDSSAELSGLQEFHRRGPAAQTVMGQALLLEHFHEAVSAAARRLDAEDLWDTKFEEHGWEFAFKKSSDSSRNDALTHALPLRPAMSPEFGIEQDRSHPAK